MSRAALLAALCLVGQASAQAGAAAAAMEQAGYHVLAVHDSDSVTLEQVMGVFKSMGVDEAQATPLIERVSAEGQAVVIAGPQESCEAAGKLFEEIGMKVEVRPLTEADLKQPAGGGAGGGSAASAGGGGGGGAASASGGAAAGGAAASGRAAAGGAAAAGGKPSEYDGSDVIVADASKLKQLMEEDGGALVTFYAPWCGHCKTMVPELKRAAATLKAGGVRVAAVDCDANKGVAQALGIKGYPAVKWVHKGKTTDYAGERKAAGFVTFATTQAAVAKVKGGVSKVLGASKKAMSKILGGAGAAGSAVAPVAAAA